MLHRRRQQVDAVSHAMNDVRYEAWLGGLEEERSATVQIFVPESRLFVYSSGKLDMPVLYLLSGTLRVSASTGCILYWNSNAVISSIFPWRVVPTFFEGIADGESPVPVYEPGRVE